LKKKKEKVPEIPCSNFNDSAKVLKRFQDRFHKVEEQCNILDPSFRKNWETIRMNGKFQYSQVDSTQHRKEHKGANLFKNTKISTTREHKGPIYLT